jgi:hypothetical protein
MEIAMIVVIIMIIITIWKPVFENPPFVRLVRKSPTFHQKWNFSTVFSTLECPSRKYIIDLKMVVRPKHVAV